MFNDKEFIQQDHKWSGDTCCLKKRPTNGEKPGVMGYSAFGIISNGREPVTIYLRDDMNPQNDFVKTKSYNTIDELLADGWIVD